MSTQVIRFDVSDATKGLTDIQRRHVPAAVGLALNRIGTTARKVVQQKIRERLAVKAAVARDAITIIRAGRNRLAVTMVVSGKPIPLKDYGARPTKKGVTYQVSRAAKRKKYLRQGRTGFIRDDAGGHVFVRIEADPPGPAKARIKKVYGPSIPQYFRTRAVRTAMVATVRERWPIEVKRALRGVLIRRTGVDVGGPE